MILVKIHESYRKIIALCDSELLGKKLQEGKMQLEVHEHFYSGKEMSDKEVLALLEDGMYEDATFNIVGKRAVALSIKAGVISKEGVMGIQGIPFALTLM